MNPGPMHKALKSVEWIIGKWRSTSAKVIYPTIDSFNYCEELSFVSIGQPNLNYNTVTWNPNTKAPMHLESGFLKVNPENTEQISCVVSHAFGFTSLEEGTVGICGDKAGIWLKSKRVAQISFTKVPLVVAIEREFILGENCDELHQVVYMETVRTPMTEHLRVAYKKVLD